MNDYSNIGYISRFLLIEHMKNINNIQKIPQLYNSFRICRDIFRNHSKSYYYGSMLFPFYKFIHICSFYAFVRIIDDIVDGEELLEIKRKKIGEIEKEFYQIFHFVKDDIESKKTFNIFNRNNFWEQKNPIYIALFFTINLLEINLDIFIDFFNSMKLDLYKVDYLNETELEVYMKGSAYIVGIFMWQLMKWNNSKEFNEEFMLEGAINLAKAFQLTNFLRDIKEDYNFTPPRIYIPLSTQKTMSLNLDIYLYRYYNNLGYLMSEYDIFRYEKLISYQYEKINNIYEKAQKTINYLDDENRNAIQLSKDLYQELNEKLNENKLYILDYKIKIGIFRKATIFYYNLGILGSINFLYRYISYNFYF